MWGRAQKHSPAFLVWSLFVYSHNPLAKAIKIPLPKWDCTCGFVMSLTGVMG